MNHGLHHALGQCLTNGLPGVEVLLDAACGGSQHLPLFMSAQRSRATEVCDVDALVMKRGQIRLIIEIEESSINPTQLAGKVLASALASHYIHETQPRPVRLAQPVRSIQVVDASLLAPGSSKQAQFRQIEARIRALLPLPGSSITGYSLLEIDGSRRPVDCAALLAAVKDALAAG